MASLGKALLKGGSGKSYRFTMFALGTRFRKLSGVYVITNRSQNPAGKYRHVTLYVGQTEDLSQPFEKHHKAKDFRRHGGNCICLQADKSEDSRVATERDLIAAFRPLCND